MVLLGLVVLIILFGRLTLCWMFDLYLVALIGIWCLSV